MSLTVSPAKAKWKRTILRFEFKPQDMWVGAFWKRQALTDEPGAFIEVIDVWVCLLPTVPFHVQFMRGAVVH